jgi:hypothetical protein
MMPTITVVSVTITIMTIYIAHAMKKTRERMISTAEKRIHADKTQRNNAPEKCDKFDKRTVLARCGFDCIGMIAHKSVKECCRKTKIFSYHGLDLGLVVANAIVSETNDAHHSNGCHDPCLVL